MHTKSVKFLAVFSCIILLIPFLSAQNPRINVGDAIDYENDKADREKRWQEEQALYMEIAVGLLNSIRQGGTQYSDAEIAEMERKRLLVDRFYTKNIIQPKLDRLSKRGDLVDLSQYYLMLDVGLPGVKGNVHQLRQKIGAALADQDVPTGVYWQIWQKKNECANLKDAQAKSACELEIDKLYEKAINLGHYGAFTESRFMNYKNRSESWLMEELVEKGNYELYVDALVQDSRVGHLHSDFWSTQNYSYYPSKFIQTAQIMNIWKNRMPADNIFVNKFDLRYVLKVMAKGKKDRQAYQATALKLQGDLYGINDKWTRYDFEAALGFYQQAAEMNHPGAHYTLGELYRIGEKVPKDLAKAFTHYEKAAAGEYGDAYARLGNFYEYGIACEKDEKKAQEYYLRAIENFSQLGFRFLKRTENRDYLKLIPPIPNQ
ncbi:MAG: tetratricopeptide repeat protein, partial [Bacteroidota bacterium]